MRKLTLIQGQITLWDLEITEKPKEVTESPIMVTNNEVLDTKTAVSFTEKSVTDKQQEVIEKYKNHSNLNRVIHYCGKGIGIELQNEDNFKTIYVNTEGKEEFTSERKIPVLPMDKILYCKSSKTEFNNTQEKKLKELLQKAPDAKVIRRKADDNILIEFQDKVVSINPIGWVLEFQGCKAVYEEYEVERQDPPEEVSLKDIQSNVKLGDIIEAQHGQRIINGEIVRVYGAGNITLNIAFDNYTKETAVHRSKVTKLIKCA